MNNNNVQIIKLNPLKEMPVIGVKIIDEKYAEDFVKKGCIHFSNPTVWRNPKLCDGKQLDQDEGCFCYSIFRNDNLFKNRGRKYVREYSAVGWKYIEKTNKVVGACFYGVLRSSFQNLPMRYGVKEIPTYNHSVPYSFFNSFRDNYTADEHKKTIIIFDLWKFRDLVVEKAMELGARREEIHISTVYYVNKHIPFYTPERFPFEYFLKDDAFSEQSELRIIIASNNKKFYKRLSKNGNNLFLGDISSIAIMQDKYSQDLDFSIRGDKLIYKLATPVSYTLEDCSFKEIVGMLYQILQNQCPGEPKEQEEIDVLVKTITDHLLKKYGVEFKDDWRLYNVPYDDYLTLPELHKGLCIITKG